MKGNYYDRSLFSKSVLTSKMTQLIKKENIKTVIITCPPFRHAYFASRLKSSFPQIRFIIDLRDPWTDNTTFLGFDTLSPQRSEYELMLEEEAMKMADKVICVNDYYKKLLQKKYPMEKDKFVHLMNGFDYDDLQVGTKSAEEGVIVTCAGTVYSAVEFLFKPFLNFIDAETSFLRNSKIKFRFYGSVDTNVKKLLKEQHNEFLEFHPVINSEEIHRKIGGSSAVMMFIAPNHGDNFNTKFYEYLAHRKPIILFANSGEIADFIEFNKLGSHVQVPGFHEALLKTLQEISSGTIEMNNKFSLDAFNIINLNDKLLKIIGHD
jgi:glycosyltransferase involved in cell wall biosynthesis